MPDYQLIGLVGHAGVGKDTAAAGLAGLGYRNEKWAGGLKAMLGALLAYQGASKDLIDRMIEGDLKEEPSEALCGRSPRHAMTTLGTEWGRDLMRSDFWIQVALRRAGVGDGLVVFSDTRFPNEVSAIRQLGGAIIKIERPGHPVDLSHPSEQFIASIEPDLTITNSAQSSQEFAEFVEAIIEGYLDA